MSILFIIGLIIVAILLGQSSKNHIENAKDFVLNLFKRDNSK
jgi:hypothetical protein